jgi:hypothetical protein
VFDTTPDGIRRLVAGGESERVEFKRRLPPQDALAQVLAVGVTEERVGAELDRLTRVARALTPAVKEVGASEVDGKTVLYATVEPAGPERAPVLTSRGEWMRRVGSTIRPVSPHEIVRNIVGAPVPKVASAGRRLRLFIAMSFREEEEPALVDYYRAIERAVAASALPLDPRRVDLVEGDYEISQRVMDEIDAADIVIADFTLSPANVYFELGYARGKGRRVIQTARRGTVLEFDVRNWRTVFYRNATELEEGRLPAANPRLQRPALRAAAEPPTR